MPNELEVKHLLIHKWERHQNKNIPFLCDYWDCPHKIQTGEYFYIEIYPGMQTMCFCLKCSAFFLAQAVNTLLEEWK